MSGVLSAIDGINHVSRIRFVVTMSRNPRFMVTQTSSTAAAVMVLSLTLLAGSAQNLRYSRVSREIIEARLARYGGDNKQRETTLKQVFAEAGCDDRHLSEQSVKDLRQPNVICLLPGTSDRRIIVGAHFDRVPAGDGVAE
jgi:hypothetical protein